MPLEYLGNPPLASDRQVRPFSPAVRAGDFVYVSGQVPAGADGEIVAVQKVDDDNRDQISEAMADYCASLVSAEDLATLTAIEGLEFNAVIEDPNDVSNGDHLVCYVTSSKKLDEALL